MAARQILRVGREVPRQAGHWTCQQIWWTITKVFQRSPALHSTDPERGSEQGSRPNQIHVQYGVRHRQRSPTPLTAACSSRSIIGYDISYRVPESELALPGRGKTRRQQPDVITDECQLGRFALAGVTLTCLSRTHTFTRNTACNDDCDVMQQSDFSSPTAWFIN